LDEEIDLRPYLATLLKNWYWIVGSGVAAAIIALIISSLIPPTYEATALVAITRPRYVLQFDSRFQNVTNIQPVYRAYPELATSDGVLQELRGGYGNLIEAESLHNLRQTVSASAGADPSLIRLSVKGRDPQAITMLANGWADIYVQRANEIFGQQNGEQVDFFRAQLNMATVELEQAQQAMIAFQGQNRSVILETQLLSFHETQAAYLTRQQALILLLADIEGLQRQLAAQPDNQPATAADQLTALLLQLQAFGSGDVAVLQLPIEGAAANAPLLAAEQRAVLAQLVEAVSGTAVYIDQQLVELEPEILRAQTELQQLEATRDRLSRNLTIAQETYTTLSRKLEEARLTTEGVGSEVQLASYAAVPERPASRGRVTMTLLAATAAVLLSSLVIIGSKWWDEASSSFQG
jgi:polysaccharide biosynthesis transport protein